MRPFRSVSEIKSSICGLISLSGFIQGIALMTSGQVSSNASTISGMCDFDAGLRTNPSSTRMDEVALLCIALGDELHRISPAYHDLVMKSVSPLLGLRLGLLGYIRRLIQPSFVPPYSFQLTSGAYRRNRSRKSYSPSEVPLRREGQLSVLCFALLRDLKAA